MTWLRLHRLHHINLRRPYAGKVIFYVCLSGCDKPRPIIHPLQQVRWGGKKHRHILRFSFSPVICLYFLFFFFFLPSLPQAYPSVHRLLTNTHFIFSFFFFLFSCSTRRPYHFPVGRPLLSNCDEWLWLLYWFPNWNNLGTKQVAVYHIDFLNWV